MAKVGPREGREGGTDGLYWICHCDLLDIGWCYSHGEVEHMGWFSIHWPPIWCHWCSTGHHSCSQTTKGGREVGCAGCLRCWRPGNTVWRWCLCVMMNFSLCRAMLCWWSVIHPNFICDFRRIKCYVCTVAMSVLSIIIPPACWCTLTRHTPRDITWPDVLAQQYLIFC